MKNNVLLKILFIFLYIYCVFIKNCISREIDSPEIILKNLYKFLNECFEPRQLIILNNKYYFNISLIKPVLNYTNYFIENESIYIIEPKLNLYFISKLYIPFNSKVKYCNEKSEQYNNLSITIYLETNFSNISFEKLEDNSYIISYHFNNNNFLNNSKIFFDYVENYSFFNKSEINEEEIKQFLDVYTNRIKIHLEEYPECDGLFLFKKMQDYILKTKYFNSTMVSLSLILEKPEVLDFKYEKHIKIDNIKSMFTYIRFNVSYDYNEFYYGWNIKRSCTIKNITIYKKELYYGDFIKSVSCDEEDEILIKEIMQTSKDSVSSFV